MDKARTEEMEYFRSRKVRTKRPVEEARRLIGKPPVSVKWVDVSKGDDFHRNCRSRLLASKFNARTKDEKTMTTEKASTEHSPYTCTGPGGLPMGGTASTQILWKIWASREDSPRRACSGTRSDI